jgi:hypothetical protein
MPGIPGPREIPFGKRLVLAREEEPWETTPEGELQNMATEADDRELGAIVAHFTQPRKAAPLPPNMVAVRALNERGEKALGDVKNEPPCKKRDMDEDEYEAATRPE